jgi:hypothetical protein
MNKIDIAPFVTNKLAIDLKFGLNRVTNGVVRMVRIPVLDFIDACTKAMKINPYMPFSPTFLGYPCDQTENLLPEVVVVHDDNTNGLINTKTELEVL